MDKNHIFLPSKLCIFVNMRSVVSLFIASVILLSGFNFGVSSHFCCGKYVSSTWGISGKKASCGMKEGIPCEKDNSASLRKKCCENKSVVISTDDYISNNIASCSKCEQSQLSAQTGTDSFTFTPHHSSLVSVNYKAPPPPSSVSIYSIRVLRI